MRRQIARIALTAAMALGAVSPAAQAETFKTTFGAGTPTTFAWQGEATAVASVPSVIKWGCATEEPYSRCDLVIFDVKDAGELEVKVAMDEAPTCDPAAGIACDKDIDLYLYKSDAAGAYAEDAEPIAEAATADQTETFKAKVQPGHYVLEVEPYQGQGVTYKGTANYAGPPAPVASAPAAEAPAPPTRIETPAPAQPQQQPAAPAEPMTVQSEKPARTGKRAACKKKAKRIKKASKRRKALKACSRKPR